MAKKQKSELPGLEDRRWVPLGDDNALWTVGDWVRKGLRVAYRERGDDHIELMLLDPRRPPPEPLYIEGPSRYFYYVWEPDFFKLRPSWSQEEERVRRKAGLQEEEVAARPQSQPPGPKPKHDWPIQVARHLISLIQAGKPVPTSKKCFSGA